MKLEKVFQLYRRVLKWSTDYCDEVYIIKMYPGDKYKHPTDVIAVFKCNDKRELTDKEVEKYNSFCEYHHVQYLIDSDGNMVFQ